MGQFSSNSIQTYRDVLVHILRAGDQGCPAELITANEATCAWTIEQFPQLRDVNLVNLAQTHNPEAVSIWLYTLGCTLFATLRDGIPLALADRLVRLREEGFSLRLRLWIDDPQVAALPWELLHHTQTREWLIQCPQFSLMRSHLNAVDLAGATVYALSRSNADQFFTFIHQSLQQGNNLESSFNAWRREGEFDLEWYRGLPMLLEAQPGVDREASAVFWLLPESGSGAPRLIQLFTFDFLLYSSFEDYLMTLFNPDQEEPAGDDPDLGDLSRPAWQREQQPWEKQPGERDFAWNDTDIDELLKGMEDWEEHQDKPTHSTSPEPQNETLDLPVMRGDATVPPAEINAQNSQGFVNNASGPLTQNFGTQYNLNGTVLNMPPTPSKVTGSLDLRLDTAVPDQVYLNEPFKLAVSIRLPTSPALDLPGLPGHFNEPFEADELENVALVFRIEVQESSDYRIVGPTFHIVRYRKGKESPALYFELIPLHVGPMDIVINVLQETANIGALRIMTTALDPALKQRGQVAAQVQVVPPADSQVEPERAAAPVTSRLSDVEERLHTLVELWILPENQPYIDQLIAYLCLEARRGDQANAARAQQIFTDLREGAPEICRAAAGAFRLPVRGVGNMFRQIAESEFKRGAD